MAASGTRYSRDLKSIVNGIADRFATACDTADGGREVRDLADEMVLDVIGALRGATLGEIASAIAVLQARRKTRAEERPASRKAGSKASKARPAARAHSRLASLAASGALASGIADSMAPPSRRDPFDITKPGELLDTEGAPKRDEERAPASVRQVRPREARAAKVAAAPKPPPAPPPKAEPPPPAVVLREGEQLLRVGGSGAVIRRVRSA
jgi:hypothetical protein